MHSRTKLLNEIPSLAKLAPLQRYYCQCRNFKAAIRRRSSWARSRKRMNNPPLPVALACEVEKANSQVRSSKEGRGRASSLAHKAELHCLKTGCERCAIHPRILQI